MMEFNPISHMELMIRSNKDLTEESLVKKIQDMYPEYGVRFDTRPGKLANYPFDTDVVKGLSVLDISGKEIIWVPFYYFKVGNREKVRVI